ncbi:MAG: DUF3105 domain-containing protein [Pseudonocardia sp.]
MRGAAAVAICALVLGGCTVEVRGQPTAPPGLSAFTPSANNQDPSRRIPGVEVQTYQGAYHVAPDQAVAYTHSPPFGGAHDSYWAACNGVVFADPVRSENLVHSLEHGAVWITYDPDRATPAALATLRSKVEAKPYMVMSPYPGLSRPISLQSWGHQLMVTDADDVRIDQFITALRLNPYTYPELSASCNALGPGLFDQDDPPPFAPVPPVSAIDGSRTFAEEG